MDEHGKSGLAEYMKSVVGILISPWAWNINIKSAGIAKTELYDLSELRSANVINALSVRYFHP